MYRAIRKPDHIPTHTSTPDGFPCDPINIVLIGTEKELHLAMRAAGWHTADQRSLRTLWKLGLSLAFGRPYPNAPFSTLYLFGRGQDVGFQRQLNGSTKHRHHVRFWAVDTKVKPRFRQHVELWRRHHHFQKRRLDSFMWVGAGTLDSGLGLIRYNGQLTHAIDPDTNKERAFIAETLEAAGWVRSMRIVKAHEKVKLKNRVLGITMEADGNVLVIDLAAPTKTVH